ncbi:MAG: hypothetical protein SGARI_003061 [Bacillariaceae sp.]
MEGTIDEDDVEKNEENVEGTEAESEPEPEPDNTMTYAEYMASKEQKTEKVDREVENEFKGMSVAVKKEEEDFFSTGGGKAKKTKKKKEDKKTIDVGFKVVLEAEVEVEDVAATAVIVVEEEVVEEDVVEVKVEEDVMAVEEEGVLDVAVVDEVVEEAESRKV